MKKAAQIRSVETLACDAGWRNYHFIKIMTEDGIVGWSEYDEGFGAPGVTAAIERLGVRVVGKNAFQHERIYAELFAATRPAAGGVVALAIGAIENALLDGKVLRNLCMHLEAIRDGAGPDVDLLLDLNFNAKTEGYLKILRAIKDMDLFWVEIDTFNPQALGYIRRQSPHPVSSCETLLGLREFLPYFNEQAMDVAIVDTPWNGVWQSMKIANAAEAYEVNVAPHNFYGHLCTMMNAHFAAAVPNLRIMETDIDRLEWDHELFTHVPEFVDGYLILPDRPGWGTEPNEEAIRAHPPKG